MITFQQSISVSNQPNAKDKVRKPIYFVKEKIEFSFCFYQSTLLIAFLVPDIIRIYLELSSSFI